MLKLTFLGLILGASGQWPENAKIEPPGSHVVQFWNQGMEMFTWSCRSKRVYDKVSLSKSIRVNGNAPSFSQSLWHLVAFKLQVREESVLSKKGVR